jgi:DNA-3-methyladenine glycosylase
MCFCIGLNRYDNFFKQFFYIWFGPRGSFTSQRIALVAQIKYLSVKGVKKLDSAFYNRKDVTKIARELLGKILVSRFDGLLTAGRIVETEAYAGIVDKASHAYGGRRTERTEVLYRPGGSAYIYLCYGIHHLFNVVTNLEDVPHAVLIRAVEPMEGIDVMLQRTGKKKLDNSLTRGPGNVSKALGLYRHHTGSSLSSDEIFIGDDGYKVSKKDISHTKRIGVDYAAEDAELPYRFVVKGNPYVSGKPSLNRERIKI